MTLIKTVHQVIWVITGNIQSQGEDCQHFNNKKHYTTSIV